MNIPDLLEILLGEFRSKLSFMSNLIPRDASLPKAPDKIKVVIGMRRAGKTYFLFQNILEMLKKGIDIKNILYLNFEDDRLLPLDTKKLSSLVDRFYARFPENHDQKCYFFFDEIQNVTDWPLIIRRLHDTKNVEIFLSGSSAKLLSKEIATSLRGRSLSTEIWPFSFNELLKAKNITIDRTLYSLKTQDLLKKQFQIFLSSGGFPEVTSYSLDERQSTLQEYLDVAIFRDIVERHAVKSPKVVKQMLLSMIHSIASPFSINKFHHYLKSEGYSIGKDSLYDFADYVEDAYLSFLVPIFHPSLRRQELAPKKVYAIDPGLARACTFDHENALGRLFENSIYLELRRLKGKISYYLTKEGYEIDFLFQPLQGKKKLIQVCWDTNNSNTYQRELRALDSAKKELGVGGEIVTLDRYLQNGLDFLS